MMSIRLHCCWPGVEYLCRHYRRSFDTIRTTWWINLYSARRRSSKPCLYNVVLRHNPLLWQTIDTSAVDPEHNPYRKLPLQRSTALQRESSKGVVTQTVLSHLTNQGGDKTGFRHAVTE